MAIVAGIAAIASCVDHVSVQEDYGIAGSDAGGLDGPGSDGPGSDAPILFDGPPTEGGSDAPLPPDAPGVDAGTGSDAGFDAGIDSGTGSDAGIDSGTLPDAPPPLDAGVPDGGLDARPDAASPIDAPASPDDGGDGGERPDANGTDQNPNGGALAKTSFYACSSGGDALPGLAPLGLALLLVRRKRRCRAGMLGS